MGGHFQTKWSEKGGDFQTKRSETVSISKNEVSP